MISTLLPLKHRIVDREQENLAGDKRVHCHSLIFTISSFLFFSFPFESFCSMRGFSMFLKKEKGESIENDGRKLLKKRRE